MQTILCREASAKWHLASACAKLFAVYCLRLTTTTSTDERETEASRLLVYLTSHIPSTVQFWPAQAGLTKLFRHLGLRLAVDWEAR